MTREDAAEGDASSSPTELSGLSSSLLCWWRLRKPSFSRSVSPRLRIRAIDVALSIPNEELLGHPILIANSPVAAAAPAHSCAPLFQCCFGRRKTGEPNTRRSTIKVEILRFGSWHAQSEGVGSSARMCVRVRREDELDTLQFKRDRKTGGHQDSQNMYRKIAQRIGLVDERRQVAGLAVLGLIVVPVELSRPDRGKLPISTRGGVVCGEERGGFKLLIEGSTDRLVSLLHGFLCLRTGEL